MSRAFVSKTQKRSPSEDFLRMVAERFRVLGEPMRLRILHALIDGEKSVTELVEATGATQANVSRHLQTLAGTGILGRRKEGLRVFYRIRDQSVLDLCDHVCGSLDRDLRERTKALR